MSETWPELPLEQWADTQTTLHRWTQMLGKTRLALAPMQNHWWQITLYVTSRGLTTSPMPYDGGTVEVAFDFFDHQLVAETSDGDRRTLPLAPRSVSQFYADYTAMLRELGVDARLYPVPMEMGDTVPFTEDNIHRAYDADAAHRCWQAMAQADRGLKDFRGSFIGKSSPSHFFWGAFDLACTRFSGRTAPAHPGGVPNCPDYVTREGYSHECISAGWWPGTVGGPVAEPAFYAYAYPEPAGCDIAPIKPEGAYYNTQLHEWILPYEQVRTASDPARAMRDFFQTTYDAAADRGKWDRAALERPPGWQPPPSVARS
ncbi:MAG TPA: DUF5996 family protein [Gemmatimonadaceae bacterium]|nr:DUF5996 family protein [Gemmatimonadaceae bacterium]